MKCAICHKEVREGSLCEICGTPVCSDHSEIRDEILTCHYCLGKEEAVDDRDEDDFAGTEM